MKVWQIYENSRWEIGICRKIIAELRESKRFSKVKRGDARILHGKAFYHVLVQE